MIRTVVNRAEMSGMHLHAQRQFLTAGLPHVSVADTKAELRETLRLQAAVARFFGHEIRVDQVVKVRIALLRRVVAAGLDEVLDVRRIEPLDRDRRPIHARHDARVVLQGVVRCDVIRDRVVLCGGRRGGQEEKEEPEACRRGNFAHGRSRS